MNIGNTPAIATRALPTQALTFRLNGPALHCTPMESPTFNRPSRIPVGSSRLQIRATSVQVVLFHRTTNSLPAARIYALLFQYFPNSCALQELSHSMFSTLSELLGQKAGGSMGPIQLSFALSLECLFLSLCTFLHARFVCFQHLPASFAKRGGVVCPRTKLDLFRSFQ